MPDPNTSAPDPKTIPPATALRPRRRAIVVGASSGTGAALAQRLAGEGYLVALLGRRQELLKVLCQEINHKHGETRAVFYGHDVSDVDVVPDLLARIISDLGGLDIFVYMAGVIFPADLEHLNFENDRRMMEVNILGAMAWLTPVSELFKSKRGGQIVGVSSVAGDRGRVGNPGNNASKAALSTYLEALRNRLTRHGVHVLTVKPGFMKTEMLKAALGGTPFAIEPERAAEDIYKALLKRKQTIYTPGLWRWIMLVIQHIPSVIFRRMSF